MEEEARRILSESCGPASRAENLADIALRLFGEDHGIELELPARETGTRAALLDITTTSYERKYKLIDESLVNRRNKIAHREYLDLEAEDFRTLADDVLKDLYEARDAAF